MSMKVKSCNTVLRMLQVCTCSYLQSVLRYTLLNLDTYLPDIVSTDMRFRGYFSKEVRGQKKKKNLGTLPQKNEDVNCEDSKT